MLSLLHWLEFLGYTLFYTEKGNLIFYDTEHYFIYCTEPDYCLVLHRLSNGGYTVRNERMEAKAIHHYNQRYI